MSGVCLCCQLSTSQAEPYRPVVPEHDVSVRFEDLRDASRSRTVPVKLFFPTNLPGSKPVVLWSHGLGSSRDGADYLGEALAAHGYVAVHVQHPGSDMAVWTGKSLQEVRQALKSSASVENFLLRVQDIDFVLDELERLNREKGPLSGQLDLTRIGMSGHSFGAITTQAVIGQRFIDPDGELRKFQDPRIKAAVIMSPSPPLKNQDSLRSFRDVSVPCLHFTGTSDSSPFDDFPPVKRRVPFDQITRADQYLLIFTGGNHMVFADHKPFLTPTSPRFHSTVSELSLAFWDAYLRQSPQAKQWLQSDPPSFLAELVEGDDWEKKPAQVR